MENKDTDKELTRCGRPPKYSIAELKDAVDMVTSGFTFDEVAGWTGIHRSYISKLLNGVYERKYK